jgi:pyruvate/2-oxoglutarate dehydrogenase complex dihydrolipoamide acyltransferase (E2) component
MYGIRQFTAVINPPQAAILAIGEAVRQPVVRGDQVTVGTTMALTCPSITGPSMEPSPPPSSLRCGN